MLRHLLLLNIFILLIFPFCINAQLYVPGASYSEQVEYDTPGTTDSRYFRRAGMKAYGFTPMLLDSYELSRIHGVDERVSTANLRWGTQVVYETLQRLCS